MIENLFKSTVFILHKIRVTFFASKIKKHKSIKKLISLLAVLFISCYALKSGVTIPANETFILGESNTKNYRAEIKNTSKFKILIKGEKKQTGEYTQGVELPPKGNLRLYVASDEVIRFINDNNTSVKISLQLTRGIEGMRYIKN